MHAKYSHSDRKTKGLPGFLLVLSFVAIASFVNSPVKMFAQGFDVPQTRLQPVGPPPTSVSPLNLPPKVQSSLGAPSLSVPPTYNATPPSLALPPASIGGGSFNPYATNPSSSGVFPSTNGTLPRFNNSGSLLGRIFNGNGGFGGNSTGVILPAPPSSIGAPIGYGSGGFETNTFGTTPSYGPQTTYGTPYQGAPYQGPVLSAPALPSYPSEAFPSSGPTTLFPEGLFNGGSMFANSQNWSAYQLLRGPRLRHAFISSFDDDPENLRINDTDISTIFAFPNFLYSFQPLLVAPSFSLHLWDGPDGSIGADLPERAYSGFIDFGWQSDPNQMVGADLGVRVGAFTDFNTFNHDSIRILGKGLATFRLTPASTLKAGVYYYDRNKVKLVPAGGLLWQPDPYTRFDIFFPQPKLARYWRTIGTQDVWWYFGGEYGGGSWTVRRTDRLEHSVDINDIRVAFGFEWGQQEYIRAGRRNMFLEVGYVFDREIRYREAPGDNFKPDDAIMFRAGIGY